MATLIFFATILFVVVLLVRLAIALLKGKTILPDLRLLGIVILSYFALWGFFYFLSNSKTVPYGTDICFDDWCATITKTEQLTLLGNTKPKGQFVILYITMSNHAKGIAQKPSEPKILMPLSW